MSRANREAQGPATPRSAPDCRPETADPPPRWLLAVATLTIFLVWGNSFVAINYLLGGDAASARFDWWTLAPARYGSIGLLAGAWCLLFRRRETLELLRRHPVRVPTCGLLTVPTYGLALFFAQATGVPAPVASLATALCPLIVVVLAAALLRERLRARQLGGLVLALTGMAVIAAGGFAAHTVDYPLALAAALVCPLTWALFTILSKPVVARTGPVTWSFATLAVGALFLLPVDPAGTWRRLLALDSVGWACLAFLVLPCTIFATPVWTWLLRHLDASILGLTIFLNPPITTASKFVLHRLWPSLRFSLAPTDWLGGALALLGVGVALLPRGRAAAGTGSPGR